MTEAATDDSGNDTMDGGSGDDDLRGDGGNGTLSLDSPMR